ncbi:MAG TPA: M3 family oligoendopeptidase [Anaerolineales bacterium]|nr:M3 family oligoendopeptidase [Anaerolineales bacterium]
MPYELTTRWKLDDLVDVAKDPTVEKAIKVFEKRVKVIEGWRKKLKPAMSAANFSALLDDYEAASREAIRLYAYAVLKFSEDTQDQQAMVLLNKVQQLYAESENRTLFFSLWWKALDEKNAKRLMKTSGDRRYFLEKMRQFKPHTLSEPEEKVINLKNVTGVSAMENLYEAITNKFSYTLEVDGEKKTLTRDELAIYVRSPKPEVREAAYKELYRVYADNGPVLAQIYAAMMRDWRNENVDMRHFNSPIAVRNLGNDLPDTVVETLLKVIRGNASVFQRYFKLKARWIGVEKLRRYDIYAPLAASEKKVEYDDAVKMVLDTFTDFSPRVGELARKVFDETHVDANPRPGKRGGAFCFGALPGVLPWVLLNYTGQVRDVAVVAHEMGHAIHALLAGHHSQLTFHSALPMAETASVFSESLLTEKLLANEPDPAVRRDLLAAAIDDAYATVGRQGFFALWEKEAHEMVRAGKTADEMAARYLETLKEQFGEALEMNDEFKWEWVSIPHFYGTPFYVYAYSFGQLLVLALYQMYKKEGEKFKPKYLKILEYGGSESPTKILTEAGINIASAKFWQGGFDVISGMIDELEKLS